MLRTRLAKPIRTCASRRPLMRAIGTVQTECGLHIDRTLPANFDKILIANRGEIACRVIRTAKALGVKTVAVFSDADAGSMHVMMADEAVRIGEPPANQSYLLSEKILEVAHETGAQAIHPGYGFLSENAKFADACAEAGVKFIGPPSDAIKAMGSKSASKIIMTDANVPVVPGYHGEDQSEEKLVAEAKKIGYPIMIKAVLGGGGKGMRIVRSEDEFLPMLDSAKREAMKSFKDDNVLLERFIERPRHIEFQVFADQQGNAVHLFERDCSVQRRHQKVLEEAPAPGMSSELREQMGKSAVDAAKAVGYEGAGTVEFIFDAVTNDYFFMEMNTRLQVEHCVSEMICKRDLVQWQLHVAAGNPIPTDQQAINNAVSGHAIEARIYAEDPDNNFLPAVGTLHHLKFPPNDSDLRVETGVRQADEVSMFYDPMISKVVVWGSNRQMALAKLDAALSEIQVVGLPTNVAFVRECLKHPEFKKGEVETNFIEDYYTDLFEPFEATKEAHAARVSAALLAYRMIEYASAEADAAAARSDDPNSPWHTRGHARVNTPRPGAFSMPLKLLSTKAESEPVDMKIEVVEAEGNTVTLKVDDSPEMDVIGLHEPGSDELVALVDGKKYKAEIVASGDEVYVFSDDGTVTFEMKRANFGASEGLGGDGCLSPMAGKVVKLLAAPGQAFKKGDQLVILEAMKMEHTVKAPRNGTVKEVLCAEGDFVEGKKLIISFETSAEE
mmetsp:Transcript_20611/g.39880  ORF Transcript_20611/g.39880 Transcript_20611/m.39880 type:complete len:728 (+) Transcript_20611:36-2219(+)